MRRVHSEEENNRDETTRSSETEHAELLTYSDDRNHKGDAAKDL
jgi:hypothetical protein